MQKKIIIALSLLLAGTTASAQNVIRESGNEYDLKYTPPQGSLFNDLGTTRRGNDNRREITFHTSFKVVPTALIRQKIVGGVQQDFSNGIVSGFKIGKAFGNDLLQTVGILIFEQESSINEEKYLSASQILNNSTWEGSFPLIGGHVRGYFSGNSFDGGYLEFFYDYERMNYNLRADVNGYPVNGVRSASLRMHAIGLSLGATFNNGNFTNEFFMNVGVKFFEADRFNRLEIPASAGSTGRDYYYYKSGTMRVSPVVAINFGYALGFGF